MLTLRKTFSLELRAQDNIIQKGLYKYIRHPAYLGSFCILVGIACFSEILSLIYLAFVFFVSRALNEERLLRNNPQYKEYQKTTGMFFPKLRSRK